MGALLVLDGGDVPDAVRGVVQPGTRPGVDGDPGVAADNSGVDRVDEHALCLGRSWTSSAGSTTRTLRGRRMSSQEMTMDSPSVPESGCRVTRRRVVAQSR